jgi:hypothetical protein
MRSGRSPASVRVGKSKSGVERYRSPWLARTATISLPFQSGRFATWNAAHAIAPDEMPTMIPSSRQRRRAVSKASSLLTLMISSSSSVFRTFGTKPAPIPWIL